MKKAVSIVLCFVLLLLSGCTQEKNVETSPTNVLNEYLSNIDSFETPVREFGTPASYIHMDTGIAVGVLYPETGYAFLDDEIISWIDDIAQEYIAQASEKTEISAELTVAYNSFAVGESTVSIIMEGTFFASYMAHPIDIIKTFNADIKTEKFIGIKDIVAENMYKDFENAVLSVTKVSPEDVDEHFLDNAVLTKDGIEIILSRGSYLPMSDGTKTAFFEYKAISHMLNKSFDYSEREPEDLPKELPLKNEENSSTIDPDKPMLALTFDDGPSAHTDRLLDIFKQYGGKGTFFVVGNLIDSRKNTVIRISNEGHEIGNHSWNHRQLTNLTGDEIKDQIMMTRAKIYDVTGKDCTVMRPPYGACNDEVKAVGKTLGVSFVNWSVDTLDWKTKNADAVYNEIINNASDGAIILCHDLHKTTVDAMETVIPKLIAEGYQLVTVSQLMEYSEKTLEAGKMYYRQ